MFFKNFEQYIAEDYSPILEGNITGRAEQAAEVFMKYINKKTKKAYKKFPYPDRFTKGSGSFIGYKFYSDKNGSAVRINNSVSAPGLIDSISVWIKSTDDDYPDYEVSSPDFPLSALLVDIVDMLKKPKDFVKILQLQESVGINEAVKLKLTPQQVDQVTSALKQGKKAKDISVEYGIPYKQILVVKRGEQAPVADQQVIQDNEKTLDDKILYHEEIMQDIYDITNAIAQGKFNSLFISGRAGTGKTYNVEKALDDNSLQLDRDYFKITGSISVVEMFKKLFQFRNSILIFDDADSVFGNEDGRNILKAALDSKKVRRISYLKKLKMLYDPKDFEDDPDGEMEAIDAGLIPNSFEFMGRVIFISNLPKEKADPDGAIRSRSILVDVNPDDATLVGVMEKLLPHLEPKELTLEEKQEIFTYVKSSRDVSMRTFVKAAGFKVAGMDNWKRMADRYI